MRAELLIPSSEFQLLYYGVENKNCEILESRTGCRKRLNLLRKYGANYFCPKGYCVHNYRYMYRLGQGKRCVNRVRVRPCLSVDVAAFFLGTYAKAGWETLNHYARNGGGRGNITPEISRVDVPTPEILSNLRSTTPEN